MNRGVVYLVGAGPGDPGLLTVRALELLRAADVVAHDKLVPGAILALANPRADRLVVGRLRGEARRSFRLHPEVLARARAGLMVVRLKCGDPMIFGRGAEEADDLAAAGIPFEIVPGVSAALGAAAYAGIPLTDRRCASSVTFTTGHDGRAGADAGHGAGNGTVVLYMGAANLADNLARLTAGGREPGTPAAYVERATERAQRVIVGTLADLAQRVAAAQPGPDGPAVVIVGEVVRLRPRTGWRERRPLAGRRVLLVGLRPDDARDARMVRELRDLGAAVELAPGGAGVPDLVLWLRVATVASPLREWLREVPVVAMDADAEREATVAGASGVICARHPSLPSTVAAVIAAIGAAGEGMPAPIAPADAHANLDAGRVIAVRRRGR
jgi:uroporphyrinogen III methyltransferase / synthase